MITPEQASPYYASIFAKYRFHGFEPVVTPDAAMSSGLIGTVLVGALIPYTDVPFLTFSLFGILYAASVPIVASLPAAVFKPENRGPGFGIYYLWYFVGSAFLPVFGGYLKDNTRTATSAMLCGAAMMMATLLLVGLFRVAQAHYKRIKQADPDF